MAFNRKIQADLIDWSKKKHRKPLILRGARQVGKTTAVREFSKEFETYIEINLDKSEDKAIFDNKRSTSELLNAIFFHKNKTQSSKKILLFIDEIQNSPEAVKQLRYFYEEYPELYVIAAGSLLETLIDKTFSFPVGRVEYLYMYPFSFEEFLTAKSKNLIKIYNQIPCPEYAFDKLINIFNKFTLIGGMPEIVASYFETGDLVLLKTIYNSLITGYKDDVEKYGNSSKQIRLIRFIIEQSFYEAGKRIKFANFGNSNYISKDVSEAFLMLEKAMLLKLMYPTTDSNLPLRVNLRKSPKLMLLDTGLINYSADYQKSLFKVDDILQIQGGLVAEHIVWQELTTLFSNRPTKIHFWVREKKQSNAEVDFVIPYKDILIPVEVKSGKTGRLRSLHQFIDNCPHNFAIRIYSGKLQIQNASTIAGKSFYLLNLPFFLTGKIEEYIEWFISSV